MSAALIEMLRYFECTRPEVVAASADERIRKLDEKIAGIKNSERVSVKYMRILEEKEYARQKARQEGLAEGKSSRRLRLPSH